MEKVFLPKGFSSLSENIQNKFTMKHYKARDTISTHSYLHFVSHLSVEKKEEMKINEK